MPIPIGGALAIPFRIFGITRSKMNPDICTICERSFRYVKKERHISEDASILFADIRGYTQLSTKMDPIVLSEIVSVFQDQCAQAIWSESGIVNKQMGDGLMAIFNFPIKNKDHARAAIRAAIDIQQRCSAALSALAARSRQPLDETLGVGVGVHTGQVEIGEFSNFRSDFTAIGGTVNLTARLESQAAAGEILISGEAAQRAVELVADAEMRSLNLKGIDGTVTGYVLSSR